MADSEYHRDTENWDWRMIRYLLKRTLIVEMCAAKHYYNWDEGSGGRETKGLLPAGGGSGGFGFWERLYRMSSDVVVHGVKRVPSRQTHGITTD